MSHEATVGVRRITSVPSDLLEEHRVDGVAGREQFVEPRLKQKKRMPPLPSLRRSAPVPLVIVPSRCCKAHPVCVLDQRAKIVVFIVLLRVRGRVTDATGSLENNPYVRARVARQSPQTRQIRHSPRIAQSSRWGAMAVRLGVEAMPAIPIVRPGQPTLLELAGRHQFRRSA